ncbi:hypothetical protein EVAR_93271_1 [Eumeta japonica]|uniref:Uncharacterized protein n=1 Tax=Eumeta variegata TaxID=151549 RepID=A0A4C1TXQ6_EUMVA|nr:hypothetical protein EVAR_93271_1 [Eumeta japonica]
MGTTIVISPPRNGFKAFDLSPSKVIGLIRGKHAWWSSEGRWSPTAMDNRIRRGVTFRDALLLSKRDHFFSLFLLKNNRLHHLADIKGPYQAKPPQRPEGPRRPLINRHYTRHRSRGRVLIPSYFLQPAGRREPLYL